MIKKVIQINQEKCVGCGACANTCHMNVIEMRDGKAHVAREDACDGLERCLPACPADAISFVEKEIAVPAVKNAAAKNTAAKPPAKNPGGCPGSAVKNITPNAAGCPGSAPAEINSSGNCCSDGQGNPGSYKVPSQLTMWPVQIKLAPLNAPYFDNADLLIAADCTAFAYGNIHSDFIKGKTVLIGCPKLDSVDYSEKLSEIFASNDIRSISVLKMEVPCCSGLSFAVQKAIQMSGKNIPLDVTTVSLDGKILQ